jgi:hypothetical protein
MTHPDTGSGGGGTTGPGRPDRATPALVVESPTDRYILGGFVGAKLRIVAVLDSWGWAIQIRTRGRTRTRERVDITPTVSTAEARRLAMGRIAALTASLVAA